MTLRRLSLVIVRYLGWRMLGYLEVPVRGLTLVCGLVRN